MKKAKSVFITQSSRIAKKPSNKHNYKRNINPYENQRFFSLTNCALSEWGGGRVINFIKTKVQATHQFTTDKASDRMKLHEFICIHDYIYSFLFWSALTAACFEKCFNHNTFYYYYLNEYIWQLARIMCTKCSMFSDIIIDVVKCMK